MNVSHEKVDLPDISSHTVEIAISKGDNFAPSKVAIQSALSEIFDSSVNNSEWHSKRAALWGRVYYIFGIPAVTLAALAGVTGLASTTGRIPAAIIALLSAVCTGAATWLNSGGQRKYHQQKSAAWYALANEAQLHYLVDAEDEDWVSRSGRETLRELLSRQAQLYGAAAAVIEVADSVDDSGA